MSFGITYSLLEGSAIEENMMDIVCTAWKVSKYWFNSGPYFSAFGMNTERYFA